VGESNPVSWFPQVNDLRDTSMMEATALSPSTIFPLASLVSDGLAPQVPLPSWILRIRFFWRFLLRPGLPEIFFSPSSVRFSSCLTLFCINPDRVGVLMSASFLFLKSHACFPGPLSFFLSVFGSMFSSRVLTSASSFYARSHPGFSEII